MKLDQTVLDELIAIEREMVRLSEHFDFALLFDEQPPYSVRRATRRGLAKRIDAICDRVGPSMGATALAVHRSIARAEAEAIEWRAFAERFDDTPADADSGDAPRRPAPTDGEARRREAAGRRVAVTRPLPRLGPHAGSGRNRRRERRRRRENNALKES